MAGASPTKMAQLRRSLSESREEEPIATSPERVPGSIPTAPAPFLTELLSSRGRSDGPTSITSSDGGASDIGRLAIKSDTYEEEEEEDGSSQPASIASPMAKERELPSSPIGVPAFPSPLSARQNEEQARPIMQPINENLLRTSAGEEAKEVSFNQRGMHAKHDSTESGVIDPDGPLDERYRNGSGSTSSEGTLTASNSTATVSVSPSDEMKSSMESQKKAKEALMMARSKSQRVKRPPVGRPMTAAEMDASDDDYEPGEW